MRRSSAGASGGGFGRRDGSRDAADLDQPGGLDEQIEGLLSTIEFETGVTAADARRQQRAPRTRRRRSVRRAWGVGLRWARRTLVVGTAALVSAAVAAAVVYVISRLLAPS